MKPIMRVFASSSTVKVELLTPGKVTTWRRLSWDKVPGLVERYRPVHVYVDALPEGRKAKALAELFPKTVTLVKS